jgi:hypothetical protein
MNNYPKNIDIYTLLSIYALIHVNVGTTLPPPVPSETYLRHPMDEQGEVMLRYTIARIKELSV